MEGNFNFASWRKEHADMFQGFEKKNVAIDIEKAAVVVAESDEGTFVEKLKALGPEKANRLRTAYVDADGSPLTM